MDNSEYVKEKLNSKHFKIGVIMSATGVSRYQMHKVSRGEAVKPYVIVALTDYFKRLGE